MIEEVYDDYEEAVKKSMIDYILLEESEMLRIGVFKRFKPIKFYGQDPEVEKVYAADTDVQKRNELSKSMLRETLSLTSKYMLDIQELWIEHDDKLLVELPEPGDKYISIEDLENAQKLLLKRKKEDLLGPWMTQLA